MRRAGLTVLTTAVAFATAFTPVPAQAAPVHSLSGLAPHLVPGAQDQGPATGSLTVSLTLQSKDPKGLDAFIATSHRALSSAQYTERFGPPAAAVTRVSNWATEQGLSVRYTPGSHLLDLIGSVDTVNAAFGASLHHFRAPGREFTASARQAAVPAAIAGDLSGVAGLNAGSQAETDATTESSGTTTPATLNKLYNPPAQYTGKGQRIAIIASGTQDTTVKDLAAFDKQYGLPQIPIDVVYAQTGTPSPGSAQIEWDLDTQYSSAMAPDTAGVTVYAGNSLGSKDINAAVSRWVDDNTAKTASLSFGACELSSGVKEWNDQLTPILKKAIAQGQTAFVASGDAGSSCSKNSTQVGTRFPTSSAYVISIGGTQPDGTGETAWAGSGGGKSTADDAQSYQLNAGGAFEGSKRGVPDVAALATGFQIVSGGAGKSVHGTSASAPVWNGFWARALSAKADLGFAGPLLYAADRAVYHDITSGKNGVYSAGTGYDYVTGLGSPDVTQLISTVHK